MPKCKTCQAGVTAVIGILGLAWLGDTFINANHDVIIGGLSDMAKAAPWTFAIGLFVASMLLYSQAATTRALMPLGLSLGIPAPFLIGMFPAVNGYFFIPNYGTLIAAMHFDRTRHDAHRQVPAEPFVHAPRHHLHRRRGRDRPGHRLVLSQIEPLTMPLDLDHHRRRGAAHRHRHRRPRGHRPARRQGRV